MKKKILLGVFVIILIASLGVNAYFLTQNSQKEKTKVGTVCGDSLIKEWNDTYLIGEGSENNRAEIVKKINEKNGSESDANCLVMKYYGGEAGKELYTKIEELANAGENPSLLIRSTESLYNMKFVWSYAEDFSSLEELVELGNE